MQTSGLTRAVLAECPLLAGLRPEVEERLARAGRVLRWASGELLFRPGDRPDWVYFLLEGTVALQMVSEAGREAVSGLIPAGAIVNVVALGSAPVNLKHGVALAPARAIALRPDDLRTAMRQEPEIGLRLTQYLVDRIMEITREYTTQAYRGVPWRVVNGLLRLRAVFGRDELPVTQTTLGMVAGTTRETAAVVLGDLRRANLIATHRGRITLLDIPGLETRLDQLGES